MTIPFAITACVLLFACTACIVGWNEHLDFCEWEGRRVAKPIRVIGWIVIVSSFTWFFCLIGDRV